jgi:hypothetical protein
MEGGVNIPLPMPTTNGSSKLSITAITKDVATGYYYILGGYTLDGGSNDWIGAYWQYNGSSATRFDFEGADLDQAPNSITVTGGAVTITGQKNFGTDKATLWTGPAGGTLTASPLADPSGDGTDNIQGGAVHQGTPYISGTYVKSGYDIAQPLYWQGSNSGVDAPLPSGGSSAEIMALYSDGTTLFGGGMWSSSYFYASGTMPPFLPCYWVAGSPWTVTDLTPTLSGGNTSGQILRISGDGNNTYLAGWYGTSNTSTQPCVWKINTGNLTPAPSLLGTPDGNDQGQALFATTSAGAVYFSGFFTQAGKDHPCYWTSSGTPTDLLTALPTNLGGQATAILFQ